MENEESEKMVIKGGIEVVSLEEEKV